MAAADGPRVPRRPGSSGVSERFAASNHLPNWVCACLWDFLVCLFVCGRERRGDERKGERRERKKEKRRGERNTGER